MLFTWNPSPLQSSRLPLEYLLLPPRSALGAVRLGITPQLPHHPHALLLVIPLYDSQASAARLSAIHFQGCSIRQVSCNTLLAGCRLSWPPPCCLDGATPFLGSDERALGRRSSASGSSRIASSAYQKWPTRGGYFAGGITQASPPPTSSKFENRVRRLPPHGL